MLEASQCPCTDMSVVAMASLGKPFNTLLPRMEGAIEKIPIHTYAAISL